MVVNAITQSYRTELRKADAKRSDKIKLFEDQSDFSEKAQNLNKTDQTAIFSLIQAQPDIRMEKIEEVKKKIEEGYYNSPEFVDLLANKLASEFYPAVAQN